MLNLATRGPEVARTSTCFSSRLSRSYSHNHLKVFFFFSGFFGPGIADGKGFVNIPALPTKQTRPKLFRWEIGGHYSRLEPLARTPGGGQRSTYQFMMFSSVFDSSCPALFRQVEQNLFA